MRHYILLIAALLGWAANGMAQQEQQYTQFMFNKLSYNPGYAGSFESPTLTLLYRNQWMGLEGSPQTQILSYNQPVFNNRVGLGGALVRNTIGISRSIAAEASYAYRIKAGRGYLGFGIQASMRYLKQDWTDDRLFGSQPLFTDNAIPLEPKTKIVPNFGFGLFYTGAKWYVGAAAPRLIRNNIDFAEYGGVLSREERHLNAMGGISFDISEGIELTPQVLLKWVEHAPFDADINLSAFIKRKFYTGVTYRTGGDSGGAGESFDAMLGLQATKNLFFCLSYDVGISKLRKYHNGSIEATARWWFVAPEGDDIVDPRYPW